MTKLMITSAQFAALRDISQKIDEPKVNEGIGLAQKSDLYNILGDFYFDVLKNQDVAAWQPLMNGSEFTYCTDEFEHEGIRALLADYTYARYVYMANVNLTAFGIGSKFTDDSEGVSRAIIKDLQKQAQVDAGIKFKTIQKYILFNPDDLFDRYCKNQNVGTGFAQQKIWKL